MTTFVRYAACIVFALPLMAQDSLTGNWVFTVQRFDTVNHRRIALQQEGTTITGKSGGMKLTGTFETGKLEAEANDGSDRPRQKISATLRSGQLLGTIKDGNDHVEFVGTRITARARSNRIGRYLRCRET